MIPAPAVLARDAVETWKVTPVPVDKADLAALIVDERDRWLLGEWVPPDPPAARRRALRELAFRATFVEPWARRVNDALHDGEIDHEELRDAFVAVLAALPSRKRLAVTAEQMTEGAAMVALGELGIATRSSEQVANGAMTDLPYIRDIAGEYGITVIDDEDEDDDEDLEEPEDEDEDEDDEGDDAL